jgi:hypothetical protein
MGRISDSVCDSLLAKGQDGDMFCFFVLCFNTATAKGLEFEVDTSAT